MSLMLQVIFRFFMTGLFAIGGGLATIPFINEMSVNYGWFSTKTLATIIAVSQAMPGPVGVNMSVYAGCVIFGKIWGGAIVALCMVAPSIIIIIIIAHMLTKFKENRLVQKVFYGIRPAVVALIASACMGLFLKTLFQVKAFKGTGNILDLFNFLHLAIYAVMLVAYYKIKIKGKKVSPIAYIVASACLGIVLKL
jgi:chromate transporter